MQPKNTDTVDLSRVPLISFKQSSLEDTPVLIIDFRNGQIIETKEYQLNYDTRNDTVGFTIKGQRFEYSYTYLMKAREEYYGLPEAVKE